MQTNHNLIQTLAECAATCEMCANACLNEENVKMMARCIKLDRDCSKICQLTASFIASESDNASKLVGLCEDICRQCAEECEKHEHGHCKQCARACRECAEACQSYQA